MLSKGHYAPAARPDQRPKSFVFAVFFASRRTRSNDERGRPLPQRHAGGDRARHRVQLRGSLSACSSHDSSSSHAASLMRVRRASSSRGQARRRLDRGERLAQQRLEVLAGRVAHRAPRDDLLELLDRSMQQHLGRAVGAAEGAGDLAVVHPEREAHDQASRRSPWSSCTPSRMRLSSSRPSTRSSVVWMALSMVVSSMWVCGLRLRSRWWLAARLWAMRMSHGRSGRPLSRAGRARSGGRPG